MKYSVFSTLICFLFGLTANAQIQSKKEIEIAINWSSLTGKSLLVQTSYKNSPDTTKATGFLVNKNNKIYLVTNYHVIPGKDFLDTNYFHDDKRGLPDIATIIFHGADNKAHPVALDISLPTSYFIVPSVQSNLYKEKYPNSVTDLVFVPIGEMHKEVILDTVPMAVNPNFRIKNNSLLSIWGFRLGGIYDNQWGSVDTLSSIGDSSFTKRNKYIFCKVYKDMRGSSGSPVFFHKDNLAAFIGMWSASMPPNLFNTRTKQDKIGIIISAFTIKYALNKYVN
jgi:hypothetical protein